MEYVYHRVSNMNSANNIRGPASFVGQPMYPGMRDNGQWLGVASEGLSDWSMPMVEFYDEQQLTKQKDQIRQRMEKLRKNRERYRGDSEAKREERPRNDASRVEPFDHEPQTSSSDMADRFASHNGRQPMRSRQPTRNRLTNVHNLW
ncbi:hypothetical protein HDE_03118 [Halotydeus destructor]|nr:hypothetical protein HDE_03118 [Halotydeus destructor]